MIKTISSALAAVAVVAFAGLTGQASAQSCSSCGPANFSFPAQAPVVAGCGGHGCKHGGGQAGSGHIANHFESLKQKFAHTATINERAAARNDAWPLPFACWDKKGYHDTWRPMLQAGNEVQGVLGTHFFTSSNELNGVGIDRVAGIVQNMPSYERTVYVSRTGDDFTDKARMDAIRNMVSTYYAQSGPVDVRLTHRIPQTVAAVKILGNRTTREGNLPPAIIPVGDATSVNQAVTQ